LGRGLIQRVPGALVLDAKAVKVKDFPTEDKRFFSLSH
jgi:hypothetical protein